MYKRRNLSTEEKERIRTRILQGDYNRETIAKEFKCSLKQIDGIAARAKNPDSWLKGKRKR